MNHSIMSCEDVHDLAMGCLLHNGCDTDNARAIADVIMAAERDGCHAHGLMRLPGYSASLQSGKVNGKARPEVVQVTQSVVRVNGNGGYAPLALQHGREALISSARQYGIAALSLVNIHHFAALWTEIEPLAEAGLAAMACVSYKPAVIPAGGNRALFGTNPLAFGWPRAGQPPMVFDQASSVVARGEVMLAAREGHELAPGIGVDREGKPSNDPNKVLDGALLAFGGHKGSSIALMIELLAGALLGECFSFEAAQRDQEDGGPPRGGELMIALDPAVISGSEEFLAHAEGLFSQIESQQGARLPGQRRYANRAATEANGIEVSHKVLESISGLTP